MKKPFHKSKVGKFVSKPAIKSLISLVPFGVGSAANELLTNTDDAEAGKMTSNKAMESILKICVYAVLLYLVFSGRIDMDQANEYKEFVAPN